MYYNTSNRCKKQKSNLKSHANMTFNEINNSRFNPAKSFPMLFLTPLSSYRKPSWLKMRKLVTSNIGLIEQAETIQIILTDGKNAYKIPQTFKNNLRKVKWKMSYYLKHSCWNSTRCLLLNGETFNAPMQAKNQIRCTSMMLLSIIVPMSLSTQ